MSLRYAYYGDDFTGSTDVLEQLAEGGVPAVLFLRAPDKALREKFPDVEAIGIAGDSRSRPPQWMEENLPGYYSTLSEAETVHYKTCSTFDSSPSMGSIGKALEIGLSQYETSLAIVVVAAPYMGRYVAFGNLFASAGANVYRVDRHPTMSRHPVTPMLEADLARHLERQTDLRISHVALDKMKTLNDANTAFDLARIDTDAVIFDGVSLDDLRITGSIILERNIKLAVGSSGVTRSLVLGWRERGLVERKIAPNSAPEVSQLLVVSGSCSPVTAKQISNAHNLGYKTILVNVKELLKNECSEAERIFASADAVLSCGESCVIYTAEGPLDIKEQAAGERLGESLGKIAKRIVRQHRLRRLLFAGGDTSSHGVAQLEVDALTWLAPIEPGAPLVKAHSNDPLIDGLELVLKGGQMGGELFFESVRRGKAVPVH